MRITINPSGGARIDQAARDAEAVKKALKAIGFDVEVVLVFNDHMLNVSECPSCVVHAYYGQV